MSRAPPVHKYSVLFINYSTRKSLHSNWHIRNHLGRLERKAIRRKLRKMRRSFKTKIGNVRTHVYKSKWISEEAAKAALPIFHFAIFHVILVFGMDLMFIAIATTYCVHFSFHSFCSLTSSDINVFYSGRIPFLGWLTRYLVQWSSIVMELNECVQLTLNYSQSIYGCGENVYDEMPWSPVHDFIIQQCRSPIK